jgi:hypothetical protein
MEGMTVVTVRRKAGGVRGKVVRNAMLYALCPMLFNNGSTAALICFIHLAPNALRLTECMEKR